MKALKHYLMNLVLNYDAWMAARQIAHKRQDEVALDYCKDVWNQYNTKYDTGRNKY